MSFGGLFPFCVESSSNFVLNICRTEEEKSLAIYVRKLRNRGCFTNSETWQKNKRVCQDEESCGRNYFGNKVVNNVPRQIIITLIIFIPQKPYLIHVRIISLVLAESWYNQRHCGRKYVVGFLTVIFHGTHF